MEEYVCVPANQMSVIGNLSQLWGLPTPRYEMEDEIVGPYCTEQNHGFLKYHAGQSAWSWVECDNPVPGLGDLPGVDHDSLVEIRTALDTLSLVRPMELPADQSKLTMSEAFTYNAWRFAWAFVPELKRWELAPLGNA